MKSITVRHYRGLEELKATVEFLRWQCKEHILSVCYGEDLKVLKDRKGRPGITIKIDKDVTLYGLKELFCYFEKNGLWIL